MKRKQTPVDRWIAGPVKRFISNSSTSGILLFTSAILALIIANSPLSDEYFHLWEINFSIGFGEEYMSKSLHHWINDGLMAVFFFVIGLELKREIIAGQLSSFRKAILPVAAAAGGMIVPALIYLLVNTSDTHGGWGIPMATDIAFALGVLYLLGDRVPLSVKVFLTAVAVVDDLGAVLVIAFFYTSSVDFASLGWGAFYLAIMIIGNLTGVRSSIFYAVVGILGLWQAFVMSGVHPTIASVLAAFTVPGTVKVSEEVCAEKVSRLLTDYKRARRRKGPVVSEEQFSLLNRIRRTTGQALTPLQTLEHSFHPLVAFIIMPVFAFSNAGIDLTGNILEQIMSPVSLGVILGLLLGKLVGVVGTVMLLTKVRLAVLPEGMTMRHITGIGFLAGIGFTMSLFVTGLAFRDEAYMAQAKIGVLIASATASVAGYLFIRSSLNKPQDTMQILPPETES